MSVDEPDQTAQRRALPRLVVVLPLEPLELGAAHPLKTWPLHVTAAPTFVIDAELSTVVEAIGPSLAQQRRLHLRAGEDAGFGDSGNIPVSLVEPSAALTDLHRRLVALLRASGATFDKPHFTGAGFNPHVTMTRIARSSLGNPLDLRQATIVDMEPRGADRLRRVVWTAELLD